MQNTLRLATEPQVLSALHCSPVSGDPGFSLAHVFSWSEVGQYQTHSRRDLQALELYFRILLASRAPCLALQVIGVFLSSFFDSAQFFLHACFNGTLLQSVYPAVC